MWSVWVRKFLSSTLYSLWCTAYYRRISRQMQKWLTNTYVTISKLIHLNSGEAFNEIIKLTNMYVTVYEVITVLISTLTDLFKVVHLVRQNFLLSVLMFTFFNRKSWWRLVMYHTSQNSTLLILCSLLWQVLRELLEQNLTFSRIWLLSHDATYVYLCLNCYRCS